MAYCGHCGAKLGEGDEFCRACGTAVSAVAPTAGPPAEPSTRRTRRIVLIVAAVVLGLLVLGGGLYLVAMNNHPQGVPVVGGSSPSTTGAGSGVATVTGGGGTAGSVTPPPVTSSTGENPVTPAKSKSTATANDVTHQATFIKKTGVADGGAHTITFDYVQFLTGPAATKAAKAHGGTADNDYYVVNDNPKLRTFPVASGVLIKLHPGDPSVSRTFTLSEFEALVTGGSTTYGGNMYGWTAQQTYYINVKNGKVTRIENQWVP